MSAHTWGHDELANDLAVRNLHAVGAQGSLFA